MRMRIILSIGLLLLFVCSNPLTPMAVADAGDDYLVIDIVIDGHDLHRTVNCNGNNVVVKANDSKLILKGQCKEVQVNGSTNILTIDVVASIILESADNTVRWKKAAQGDKPKVVDRSSGNKVEQIK